MNDDQHGTDYATLSLCLAGFLDALMILSGIEAAEGVDDDDLDRRVARAWVAVAPHIVFKWQAFTDDGQRQFLADHPEHAEGVKDVLVRFAAGTGEDMAAMTTRTRRWQDRLTQLQDEEGGR